MRRVLSIILWLTLVPATFALTIEDPSLQKMPSNFGNCDDLRALSPEPALIGVTEISDSLQSFGSVTGGFADYSATDTLLRFLDEFVMASMQSTELRHKLRFYLDYDFGAITSQLDDVYSLIARN
jgi:hypothetical protein